MRLPDFFPLALADELGLRRGLFFNADVDPATGDQNAPVPAVSYRSFTGEVWCNGPANTDFRAPDQANRTWIATNGLRARRAAHTDGPREINSGFGVASGQTAGQLLDAAPQPVYDRFSYRDASGVGVNKPVPEWIDGWARLICALLPGPRDEIRMNRRMIRMEYRALDRDCSSCTHVSRDGPHVWVETTSERGGDDAHSGTPNREVETFTADVAVVTIPFPALRHVAVEPLMSYPERRGVIELRYDSATKVLLELAAGAGPSSERRTRGAPDHTFSGALSLVSP